MFARFCIVMFIPPVYEVYRGSIVFAFSVTTFVCLCVCKLFFSSKTSQDLLDLGITVNKNQGAEIYFCLLFLSFLFSISHSSLMNMENFVKDFSRTT